MQDRRNRGALKRQAVVVNSGVDTEGGEETEEEAKRNTDVLRGTEMNKRWRQTDRIAKVAEVGERAAGTIRF